LTSVIVGGEWSASRLGRSPVPFEYEAVLNCIANNLNLFFELGLLQKGGKFCAIAHHQKVKKGKDIPVTGRGGP
jgi:hypothetical protein